MSRGKSKDGAVREQSLAEELANAITHGIGALWSMAGLVLMVVRAAVRGDAWQVVASSLYGASLVVLYLSSTLYHAFPESRAKKVFQAMDHAAIFFLIAGTYTPFTLVTLRGPWGWSLFGVTWGLALAGATLTVVFLDRFPRLSLAVYLLMGWVVLVALKPLLEALPRPGLLWLLAGGLAYSLGTIFYRQHQRRWMHAVWHLFVLAGSLCHWVAVYGWVIGH